MCMWNQLFQNNEGWGRTLINFEKNSTQDRFIVVTSLLRFEIISIYSIHNERFSQKNHSKLGGNKSRVQ